MKKRVVFDLDNTLLHGHYELLDYYFTDLFGEEAVPFLRNMTHILDRYERTYPRYDVDSLSQYLTKVTQLDMNPKVIREWDGLVNVLVDDEEEHVREVLEYLKAKDKSLAVLTNWFGASQKERLRRVDLLQYFDGFYGGDVATKPHKEAYAIATVGFQPEECIFIGDNLANDYVGPKACSMDAILFDKHDSHHKSLVKIKSLEELKRMF